ncbi:MAG: DUF6883 domain-containing protein [Candidatus Bipolaricaulia bacterium]
MKLPHKDKAIIDQRKLVEYLLNTAHKRGGTKARLLAQFGYSAYNWQQLEADIRLYHLSADVEVARRTLYGMRYEIRAPLHTPSGRTLIDDGTDVPRLITLIPD